MYQHLHEYWLAQSFIMQLRIWCNSVRLRIPSTGNWTGIYHSYSVLHVDLNGLGSKSLRTRHCRQQSTLYIFLWLVFSSSACLLLSGYSVGSKTFWKVVKVESENLWGKWSFFITCGRNIGSSVIEYVLLSNNSQNGNDRLFALYSEITIFPCLFSFYIIIFYMLHLVLLLLTTSMTMKRFFKIYFFFSFADKYKIQIISEDIVVIDHHERQIGPSRKS